MPYTQIIREQLVKTNIDKLWSFVSSPKNLEKITPNYMKFNITSNNKNEAMYKKLLETTNYYYFFILFSY